MSDNDFPWWCPPDPEDSGYPTSGAQPGSWGQSTQAKPLRDSNAAPNWWRKAPTYSEEELNRIPARLLYRIRRGQAALPPGTASSEANLIVENLSRLNYAPEHIVTLIASESAADGPFARQYTIQLLRDFVRATHRNTSRTIKSLASEFQYVSPVSISPREWLHAEHYVRGFVSVTLAQSGVGKSTLVIAEALEMVTGRSFVSSAPPVGPLNVWMINGEDPLLELCRRVQAAMIKFNVEPREVMGRLFINSGRDREFVLGKISNDGFEVDDQLAAGIIHACQKHSIDAVIVDPFVSFHRVSENDNLAIDGVAKGWQRIAHEAECSVEIVHHPRKSNSGETTVDDSRGASSLIAAARSVRTLNQMTPDQAQRAGVENHRAYFRIDTGKANLRAPETSSQWRQLESVSLNNGPYGSKGDSVAVAVLWEFPDVPADVSPEELLAVQNAVQGGNWRESAQANEWVGLAVARALGLDIARPSVRRKVRGLLKTWIDRGALTIVSRQSANRKIKRFVEVGIWADCSTTPGGAERKP